ncbi:MAG: sulfatase [Planctomycetota bacterium]
MRRFLLTVVLASAHFAQAAVAITALGADAPASLDVQPLANGAAARPDVLVILTDQWNPRCLGFEGDEAARTPNLDRLAAEGIIFESNYTPCPVCMPARCGILSGLYPHNTNLWGNNSNYYLPPESAPMFRDIRAAGYTTAQIGKLHWTGGRAWQQRFQSLDEYYAALGLDFVDELPSPFSTPGATGPYVEHLRKIGRLDAYRRDMSQRVEQGQYLPRPSAVEPEDHNDSFVADRAIAFLESLPRDKPYCLAVSFFGPHPPFDAPGRYATLIDAASIELPPNAPDDFKYHDTTYDRAAQQAFRANYYGKIALIDDNIGRIIDVLKQRGTWQNTLVIFSSDHGEMLGAHGHLSKGRFYEESGRVPLVMRWPGRIPPARRTKALSQLFDIYPTVVEAISGKLSPGHFAVSLLPVATGAKPAVREVVFSEIGSKDSLRYMVRTPRYVWWVFDGREALYDLEQDPYQQQNLIESPEHQRVLDEIASRHLAYFRGTQVNLSAGTRPMLERLKERAGGKSKGLAERLYEQYKAADKEEN